MGTIKLAPGCYVCVHAEKDVRSKGSVCAQCLMGRPKFKEASGAVLRKRGIEKNADGDFIVIDNHEKYEGEQL